jgi:PAS domain S-box-containing protein
MNRKGLPALLSEHPALRDRFAVLDSAPVAFLLLSADGWIYAANSQAGKILWPYTWAGHKERLAAHIEEDDQSLYTQWLSQLTQASSRTLQVHLRHKDGKRLYVQLRAGEDPFAHDPCQLYLVALTEQKEVMDGGAQKAELYFQSQVLDSIGEAVIATDLQGHILYWNKAAEKIYGWKAEEVLGKNIVTVTTVEENKEQGIEIMAALQSGHSWSGEFTVRHRDGHHFPAHVTDSCLRDPNGELAVIIGVSIDLTEKKQKEQQLKVLERQLYEQKLALAAAENAHLEKASRFKSEFIANMSHEIRTPLAIIRGYAEILEDSRQHPESRERIQSILRASRQVETLVNDILDISKIEAGKIELELLPTPIAAILGDIKEMLQIKAREKNIELNFAVDPDVPPLIQTDPVRLKQILLNVIGNALKFTNQGDVSVKVQMISAELSPLLAFIIRDTGIGMTPEQSRRIFSAYSQADPSITRKYGGTGLGLSLSLRLAQLLGGDLKLESSEPGKGSSFMLTIHPGAIPETVMLRKIQTAVSPLAKKTRFEAQLCGMRILVVEDAEDVRAIVKQVLKRQEAVITEAGNGEEAVQLALEQDFDAILMDLQMPVCDGLNATRRLRQAGLDVPIFALTAHAMTGERERCLAAGFNGYFTKPINFKEMMEALSLVSKYAQGALRSNEL